MDCESHNRKLMLSGFFWESECRYEIWNMCRGAHHWLTPWSLEPRLCTSKSCCNNKVVSGLLTHVVYVSEIGQASMQV